jgi:hypothetical protein
MGQGLAVFVIQDDWQDNLASEWLLRRVKWLIFVRQ